MTPGLTTYHWKRPDGRVCSIQAFFDGSFTFRIVRSCDESEVNTEADPTQFTDEGTTCFVCIANGAL